MQDLKYSLRQLLKSPGFTAVAVATLALAIGINTAIFSIVNGVLLRPTVSNARGEIVEMYTARQQANRDYRQFSWQEFAALQEPNDVFADLGAVTFALAGIGLDDAMQRSFVFMVSQDYFQVFGAQPAAGRFFSANECRPNADIPVAIASWNFWQRHGGRGDFVGSTLRVNGRLFTIVGVTPRGFSNGNALIAPEIWLPLGVFSTLALNFSDNAAVTDLNHPRNFTLNIAGRLKPGLTAATAAMRLPALAARINALHPEEATGPRELQLHAPSRFSISTEPQQEDGLGMISVLLLGMAGAVLLIASLNLANMLLARGTARHREIAIRLALGATRRVVVRQLLVEGLMLAVIGGALGLIFSLWAGDLLTQSLSGLFSSMNFSYIVELHPDLTVTLVTFLFCLLATAIFSLGPALRATRVDLVNDLKQQSGDAARHGRLNRFFAPRHLLVMAQIALSLMLLFSAGLFFRAALKVGGLDLGYQPAGCALAEIDYSLTRASLPTARQKLRSELEQVQRLPGVASAGFTSNEPFSNETNIRSLIPADRPAKTADGKDQPRQSGLFAAVTPGYFEALGVHLLRGRDFTANEAFDPASRGVCIVDQAMAKALFPDGDALGQRVRYNQPPSDGTPVEMEIVGILNDHRSGVLDQGTTKHLYVPLAQSTSPGGMIHVRLTAATPERVAGFLPTLRRAIRQVDPTAPLLQVMPFTAFIEKDIGFWLVRVAAIMFGAFGGIALLLAAVGVYGVKAYAVARRTREIGIRMALGAQYRDVFNLIMKQGALQTLVAVVAGVALALLAGRALSSLLYKVSPTDPLVLVIASAVLAAAALLACYVPARRATRVNPNQALRTE